MSLAIVPSPLSHGDRIRVVAPSGPFDRTLVLRGIGWLKERYEVCFGDSLFAQEGFLAGPDERRLAELDEALRDRKARAIVATRGGYGLTRIAHAVDLSPLREDPKWIVGFSDVTALHVEVRRLGIASLHAHNVAGLGRGDDAARERWDSALTSPAPRATFAGLTVVRSGRARGPTFGGNLTVLFTCAAAGRLAIPEGSVLVLEDVGEAPYRVDRMLSALSAGGHFDRLAAVLLGSFTDAPAGRYGVPIDAVLGERLQGLGIPVLSGLPVGHGAENEPVPLGIEARVDAVSASVELG